MIKILSLSIAFGFALWVWRRQIGDVSWLGIDWPLTPAMMGLHHVACEKPPVTSQSVRAEFPQTTLKVDNCRHSDSRNDCKLCTPLGACLVFRGMEGCLPFLHSSQECSHYIQQYLGSHFREPVAIPSSDFKSSELSLGGRRYPSAPLNVTRQHHPQIIGVATSCIAESNGIDVPTQVRDYFLNNTGHAPKVIRVPASNHFATHADGFHAAVAEVVDQLAGAGAARGDINLFPGMVAPADLRHLKEIFDDFALPLTLLPDYSESLDGGIWSESQPLQQGGTPLKKIASMGGHRASIEFGAEFLDRSAGALLLEKFGVENHRLPLPIGLQACDRFFGLLESLSDKFIPARYGRERARLLDSYVDGRKYVQAKRAVIYGEEDLVAALAGFLCEIGVTPVLCASGSRSGHFSSAIRAAVPNLPIDTVIRDRSDFSDIALLAQDLSPDFLIGSSKGHAFAHRMNIPLIRVGFPIHDRLGAQRLHALGYLGTQELFDRLVNALIESGLNR